MQLSRNLAPTAIYVPLFVLPEAEVYIAPPIQQSDRSTMVQVSTISFAIRQSEQAVKGSFHEF